MNTVFFNTGFYALREHVGSLQDSFIMNSTVVDCHRGGNILSECWSSEQHECRAKAAVLCTGLSILLSIMWNIKTSPQMPVVKKTLFGWLVVIV